MLKSPRKARHRSEHRHAGKDKAPDAAAAKAEGTIVSTTNGHKFTRMEEGERPQRACPDGERVRRLESPDLRKLYDMRSGYYRSFSEQETAARPERCRCLNHGWTQINTDEDSECWCGGRGSGLLNDRFPVATKPLRHLLRRPHAGGFGPRPGRCRIRTRRVPARGGRSG